jgi:hypothetical protein
MARGRAARFYMIPLQVSLSVSWPSGIMTYPRELHGSAISDDLKTLIHALATRLLDGATSQHALLRRQLAGANIDHVTLTGAGVFAYFTVLPDAPTIVPDELIGGEVEIISAALDAPAGSLIAVKNGRLSFVEIYTYGDKPWPDIPGVMSLGMALPIPINETAS